tara:strand:- start:4190 stop:5437 length:1248 start_codon:yes stop_codon:yes gene_type:complete
MDVKNHATLSTSLVSYWELESDGTDSVTGTGNDLSETNSPNYVAGKQGNGVDLESNNNQQLFITDGDQTGLDPAGDFSISWWMKMETKQGMKVFDKLYNSSPKQGWRVELGTAGSDKDIVVIIKNNHNTTEDRGGLLTDSEVGVFVHCVIVYDASADSSIIYQDGVDTENSQSSGAGSVGNSTQNFNIGGVEGDSSEDFDGVIDEVGYWSKKLSVGEVTDLYNSGSGIPYEVSNVDYTTSVSETVSISSTVTLLHTLVVSIIEAISLSPSSVYAVTFGEIVNETLSLSETVTVGLSLTKSITEALGLSDISSLEILQSISITEGLSLSDTSTLVTTYGKIVSESLSISDSVTIIRGFIESITETLSISDSASLVNVFTVTVTETLNIVDDLAKGGWSWVSKNASGSWTFLARNEP